MTADALLEVLAERVAVRVVERLRAGEVGMIDQTRSPLGRRRHIAAVRRLVAAGKAGAAVVGRRYLLSREALDAEVARLSKRPRKAHADDSDKLAALRERFGFERTGT